MKLGRIVPINTLKKIIDIDILQGEAYSIDGINEIHKVSTGDVTFVDHPKYYQKALNSEATVVIIDKADVPNPLNRTLLLSKNPFSDYVKLVKHFRPFTPMTANISPTATIGEGTVLQPNVTIGNHVSIGKNCVIHPNVVIYDHAVIGDHVIIHANTTIGADAFYYKNRGTHFERMVSCGRVVIEDYVEIGANCTIDKGVSGDTVIGAHTKIDNLGHIAHGVVIGKRCLIAAQVGIAGKTIIEDEVTIWGQVGISKDLTIGKKAVISGKSGVSKSLEGGKWYFGTPAREGRTAHKELAALRMLPDFLKKRKKT
ncbi:MAG: UDP-3-O-(3-hydroxymyristoyl)glucosamine N-acyltransferase [Chitinophagales bacterium]